jgi:[NiFe] hydrogenase diaphorase moiety small subunit
MTARFLLDGEPVAFAAGQTILQAAHAAGKYIPHLCWLPDFRPHGSCRLCTVRIDGRLVSACTALAVDGQWVENRSSELDAKRVTLLQMLFVEGNHFCPGCEVSGSCKLQATAYEMGMLSSQFEHFFPDRAIDASHPDVLLEFNRCILCELCVQASRDIDRKQVFAVSGRGLAARLIVNSDSGRLADSDFAASDRAAGVCPVGVILRKRVGFATPIGARRFDAAPISQQPDESGGESLL